MAIEISCINKTDREDPHERISHVGGVINGTRWHQTVEETIQEIEDEKFSYYVKVGGDRVDVIVASRLGNKYLKTRNDGDQPNNLLSLSECPLG